MFHRWLKRWADADVLSRLAEARREIERLEGVVTIQADQIKRLVAWQARETERLEAETAILTARKVAALDAMGRQTEVEE